jgi:hypothetical protein
MNRLACLATLALGCGGAPALAVSPDAPLPCGPGTHDMGGVCAPDAEGYEIRVASSQIPADGYSKIPVLVIGTQADGSPALDQVVLNTSRPGAGTFTPPAVTLTPLGATVYYTPCSSTTPGCVGPVTLTLAAGAHPSEAVAQVAVALVAPAGVGSAAACAVGGTVMMLDGQNDYIFSGTETVRAGTFGASVASPSSIEISVTPGDAMQGAFWYLTFSSDQLGQPLATQTYEMAERAPFASPGHPGLDVEGDGRGCNTLTGRFQIEDLALTGSVLTAFTATFEQHCEGGSGVVRGCIHYQP